MDSSNTTTGKITSPTLIGIILSLVLIVFSQVTILTDQMQNKALGWIPSVIAIVVLIWACINYSNQKNHNVTFGNVFAYGFKVVATVTALMALYTLLLFLVIKPELRDISLEQAREAMEKRGTSEDQMEQGIEMTKRLFIPFAIVGVILIYGIGGTIIALIGAAVAKKNPNPSPF